MWHVFIQTFMKQKVKKIIPLFSSPHTYFSHISAFVILLPVETPLCYMSVSGLHMYLWNNYLWYIWVKVFKNGPSKICGRQPLKNLVIWSALHFKFFKGCLPKILVGPFLNTLTHFIV